MSAFDKLRLRLAEPSTRTKSSNNIPDVEIENQSSSGNSFIRQAFAERKQNHGNFRANAPKPAVTVRAPRPAYPKSQKTQTLMCLQAYDEEGPTAAVAAAATAAAERIAAENIFSVEELSLIHI